MFSKFNTIGAMTLILIAVVLVFCFMGSPVYAGDEGGGGGQWPDEVPPQPTGGGDGSSEGGSLIIIGTIATILGVIL